MRVTLILAAFVLALISGPTTRGEAAGKPSNDDAPAELGAASNFSQGWNEATMRAALALPVRRFRDSIRWGEVEKVAGEFQFAKPTARYPEWIADGSAKLTLTLNWGNPLYDGGKTPHSTEALRAFGAFAARAVQQYPAIDTVEIGNEINGGNFVSGVVKEAGLAGRADYHLAMVAAASAAIHKVRPDVRVLGGATHSLPAGFLWTLLDKPGASVIQGLAVHPYTTPVDQLPAQFAVQRSRGRAATLPIHVTEFGSSNPDTAADDLVRGYATLSALGVREVDWYPLSERGDGMVPLLRRDQSLTNAGLAFRFVQSRLAPFCASERDPDPFTFVRSFGSRTWVIWGEPRSVTVAEGITAQDATGAQLDLSRLELASDKVIVLTSTAPLVLGRNVTFGCQSLIADSFHQFSYAPQESVDPFERFIRVAGRAERFELLPGQQRRGVPWTPYLGRSAWPRLRVLADTMLPALPGPRDAIVHRYVARKAETLDVSARFSVSSRSTDGIRVAVEKDGQVIVEQEVRSALHFEKTVALEAGAALTFLVSPGADSRGDATDYRIRLFDKNKCKSAPS